MSYRLQNKKRDRINGTHDIVFDPLDEAQYASNYSVPLINLGSVILPLLILH